MNITIFNREYVMRRFAPDGSYEDSTISVHLHASENGGGSPWAESQGIVRQVQGHGMVPLREADLEAGTKADRVFYRGRWYECTSSTLYDHTSLAHYNYSFIVVPEDAIETITIFNLVFDPENGLDIYVPTVIRGVSWLGPELTTQENLGVKSATRFTIRIPEEADFSGKEYVAPVDFTGEDGTFTFMPGDIIVHAQEETVTKPAELQKKYRTIVKVMNVYDFRTAPNHRHWKLEGE